MHNIAKSIFVYNTGGPKIEDSDVNVKKLNFSSYKQNKTYISDVFDRYRFILFHLNHLQFLKWSGPISVGFPHCCWSWILPLTWADMGSIWILNIGSSLFSVRIPHLKRCVGHFVVAATFEEGNRKIGGKSGRLTRCYSENLGQLGNSSHFLSRVPNCRGPPPPIES